MANARLWESTVTVAPRTARRWSASPSGVRRKTPVSSKGLTLPPDERTHRERRGDLEADERVLVSRVQAYVTELKGLAAKAGAL